MDSCFVMREIDTSTPDYQAALTLRDEVLRKPFGVSREEEKFSDTPEDIHICGFCEGELVANLTMTPMDLTTLRMRQVAVGAGLQGKGLGHRMVGYAEAVARKKGFKHMYLHARKNAVDFYLSQGYRVCGGEFVEIGIQHFPMEKDL